MFLNRPQTDIAKRRNHAAGFALCYPKQNFRFAPRNAQILKSFQAEKFTFFEHQSSLVRHGVIHETNCQFPVLIGYWAETLRKRTSQTNHSTARSICQQSRAIRSNRKNRTSAGISPARTGDSYYSGTANVAFVKN